MKKAGKSSLTSCEVLQAPESWSKYTTQVFYYFLRNFVLLCQPVWKSYVSFSSIILDQCVPIIIWPITPPKSTILFLFLNFNSVLLILLFSNLVSFSKLGLDRTTHSYEFDFTYKISIQWGSEIRPFKNQKHLKTGQIRGPIFERSTIEKPEQFENRMFLTSKTSGFQMSYHHFRTYLLLTIRKPDTSGFQIPAVHQFWFAAQFN